MNGLCSQWEGAHDKSVLPLSSHLFTAKADAAQRPSADHTDMLLGLSASRAKDTSRVYNLFSLHYSDAVAENANNHAGLHFYEKSEAFVQIHLFHSDILLFKYRLLKTPSFLHWPASALFSEIT